MQLITLVLLLAAQSDSAPPALRKFEEARKKIAKADIEWTRRDLFSPGSLGEPKKYRSLFANKDKAYFNYGMNGITGWTEDNEPVRDPHNTLWRDGEYWEFHTDLLTADLWEHSPDPLLDIRIVGMLPVPKLDSNAEDILDWEPDPEKRKSFTYTERRAGGAYEVELRLPGGRSSIQWTIDPDLGWNATHARIVFDGRVVSECISDYQQIDGTWFPASSNYYNERGDLAVSIDVTSARFDASSLPDALTPEDIGFGNGMSIIGQEGKFDKEWDLTYVDGKIVTRKEFHRLCREGEVEISPRPIAGIHEVDQKGPPPESNNVSREILPDHAHRPASQPTVDEWERYTLDFAARNSFDDGQRSAALRILRDCQTRRGTVLRHRESRLRQLEQAVARESSDSAARNLAAERAAIASQMDEIFQNRLKPRLDGLLTRAQRAKASRKDAPETAPGKP